MITTGQNIAFSLTWGLLLLGSWIAMKWWSFNWTFPVVFRHPILFWISPVTTASTWKNVEAGHYRSKIKLRKGLTFAALLILYYLVFIWISRQGYSSLVVGYLGALLLYLWFHALDTVSWVVGRLSGCWIPPLLDHVFRSKSLSEFWAYRWNTFINQWFREGSLRFRRRHPKLALWGVFLVSGLWHEVLINIPFYFITGRCFIGSMTLYFHIEWLGILLQRRFPKMLRHRLVTVLWILVPAPLVFNPASLRGLWLLH